TLRAASPPGPLDAPALAVGLGERGRHLLDAVLAAAVRVADLHCDTLLELQGGASLEGHAEGHVDLPRLVRGDVGLQVFVAYVSTTFPVGRAFREAMDLLDRLDDACARFPQHLQKCVKAEEIERASQAGKVAAVPALENGHAIESDLKKLEA